MSCLVLSIEFMVMETVCSGHYPSTCLAMKNFTLRLEDWWILWNFIKIHLVHLLIIFHHT